MPETKEVLSPKMEAPIRIKRLNTDKTRKDVGSDTVYHIYFELSAYPPPEWVAIFGREWDARKTSRKAEVDGGFLVLHCEIREVPARLFPALQQAVATTNAAFGQFEVKEASAQEQREDVWKQERKDVEAMAASLRIE
jgi:hypothetical protein